MSKDFKNAMRLINVFRMHTAYCVNARTKHMDAIVRAAVVDGAVQVVNLGAGYDSRAYRFRKTMPQVKFFEIELPAMVEEKKRRLERVFFRRCTGLRGLCTHRCQHPNHSGRAGQSRL
jgi:methyltransferase (TIGR00027 family)